MLPAASWRAIVMLALLVCAAAQCTLACAGAACGLPANPANLPPCHRHHSPQPGKTQPCDRLTFVAAARGAQPFVPLQAFVAPLPIAIAPDPSPHRHSAAAAISPPIRPSSGSAILRI